jgi:carbonic anhydrase
MNYKSCIWLLVSLGAFAARDARSSGAAPTPASSQEKAVEITRSILTDNASFVSGKSEAFFTPFKDAQHPRATVVMCADSRVHTHAFENTPDGDLFVIRNIGNQVLSNPGSVEYGVRHLHTPLLLIIGHVACGAVKAALGDYRTLSNAIREPLDRLHLALDQSRKQAESEARWRAGIEENVHYQVDEALSTYKEEISSGKLTVVGAVYDFQNVYGQGRGRLVLLNVNGERDPRRIPKTPLLAAAAAPAQQRLTVPPPGSDAPQTQVKFVEAQAGGSIRIVFNEPVNPASIVATSFAQRPYVPGTITVKNTNGDHELASIETYGSEVIVTPYEVMKGSELIVTVTPGVQDIRGNPFPAKQQAKVTLR